MSSLLWFIEGYERFSWDDKYEQAFRSLKEYLGKLSLLLKPVEGELLYLYLVVTDHAILGALIREEEKVQWPIYYIGKWLIDVETRYTEIEKMALALVITSRKLRSYFHSHTIWVLTNYTLRQVLQKLDASGRLLRWTIELNQCEIKFQPWPAIKGQALVDFIAEFSHTPNELPDEAPAASKPKIPKWGMYMEVSSNDRGSGARLIFISPEGHRLHCTLGFGFKASNKEAEYETLIAGLNESQIAGNIYQFPTRCMSNHDYQA